MWNLEQQLLLISQRVSQEGDPLSANELFRNIFPERQLKNMAIPFAQSDHLITGFLEQVELSPEKFKLIFGDGLRSSTEFG